MLRREDYDTLAQGDAAVIRHRVGYRTENLFRCVAAMVFDIAEPARGKDRDAGNALRVTLRLAEQRPRIVAGALGDAEAVFSRLPLGRFIGNPRDHLKHVA